MEINYTLATSRITYDGDAKHTHITNTVYLTNAFTLAIITLTPLALAAKFSFRFFLFQFMDDGIKVCCCALHTHLDSTNKHIYTESELNMTLKCVNCPINGYQVFHICIIQVWLPRICIARVPVVVQSSSASTYCFNALLNKSSEKLFFISISI